MVEPRKQKAKIGKVMGEMKRKKLHSGSKTGPIVKDRKQALAIAMSDAGMPKLSRAHGKELARKVGKRIEAKSHKSPMY